MSNPTPIVFIVGWCPSQAKYDDLMFGGHPYNVRDFWTNNLPSGTPLLVTQWNVATRAESDAYSIAHMALNIIAIKGMISDKFGSRLVKVGGHSFGACCSLEVAAALASMQCPAFAIDPVDYRHPDKPNTTGLYCPPNVPLCKCWYRDKPTPGTSWSTFIAGVAALGQGMSNIATRQIVNTLYPANQMNNHGWGVWDRAIIGAVGAMG